MNALLDRLRRRKLVHWSLGYLAGAWVCLQVLDFFGQHFHWSPRVIPAATAFLTIGFLAAVVMAWYHGERGRQHLSTVEGLLLAVILVAAGAAAAVVARQDGKPGSAARPDRQGEGDAAEDRSIAVLPFQNMSDSKENEYFSDGITEDVLTNLSRIGTLRVISRASSMRFKGTDASMAEIARELGVVHILVGSVRRAGERVRITAELIRAGRDERMWSESYDGDVSDIFEVQSKIAREIAGALALRLTPGESKQLELPPTANLEAYDRFLRGRDFYQRGGGTENTDAAIRLLREATALDPQFGLALAILARAYKERSYRTPNAAARLAFNDSALAAAQRAIKVAPELADGYSALGEVYRSSGRFGRALDQYKRALALDPNHAYSLAEYGETNGRFGLGNLDVAITWLMRAIAVDPSAGWMYTQIAYAYRLLGDYDASARWLERGLRNAHYFKDGLQLAAIELDAERGAWAAAKARLDERMIAEGDSRGGAFDAAFTALRYGNDTLALAYARLIPDSSRLRRDPVILWILGDRAGAARAAGTSSSRSATHEAFAQGDSSSGLWLRLATEAAVLGDQESVITDLEQYVARGGREYGQLTRSPIFAVVRSSPRFTKLTNGLRAELERQRKSLRDAGR